jgi:2-polyprenyl-3-methyl-5-hydroxy-6-metoxy-1,4-benzoquinol methylase
MIPLYVNETAQRSYRRVLDAGCGVGLLSRAIAPHVQAIEAIDLSPRSIDVAIQNCAQPNVKFSVGDVALLDRRSFDLVIANMFFMDCLDLKAVVRGLASCCTDNAVLLATITNPFVWPRYWNYEERKWFDYRREIVIEADFRIMEEAVSFRTTHVHRPLSMYVETLRSNGFQIEALGELTGAVGRAWKRTTPRHLFVRSIFAP